MLRFLQRLDRGQRAILGLVFAVILFLSVNVLSNTLLQSTQLDLTKGNLFTLSQGTREVLSDVGEPISLTLFFSKALGERNPEYARYANRVRELLEQYGDISDGRVRLRVENAAPFTDSEDRAVGFGLQGVPINAAGEEGYFGLVGQNSTDDEEIVRFFPLEREPFLEYDLTKLVYRLAQPEKPTVGLISSLPIAGTYQPPYGVLPRWGVVEHISELFEVMSLPTDLRDVPPEVDVLMIVHPKAMGEHTRYAIDQFIVKGGKALVFVDPLAEAEMALNQQIKQAGPPWSTFNEVMENWGLRMVDRRVAGDLDTARRVNLRQNDELVVADYVAWLELQESNFDSEDTVTGALRGVNMATAGILEPVPGAKTAVTPLITVGPRTMRLEALKFMQGPDVAALFREFRPQNETLTLAARVSGVVDSAFPAGPPTAGGRVDPDKVASHQATGKEPASVVVVADTDMLHDRFWVDEREVDGSRILVPFADNADFVVNALDMLTGSQALVSLRGRAASVRPFEYVHQIRQEAEQQFRAKEQELRDKLADVQRRLGSLVRREIGTEGAPILSREDREAIEAGRREMLAIRKELRDVQFALRADIDRLDARLKFFNIAAIPLLLATLTLIGAAAMRIRRRRYVSPH